MPAGRPPCRCGHSAAMHEHYRRGSDCGICGSRTCRRYRRGPADVLEIPASTLDALVDEP